MNAPAERLIASSATPARYIEDALSCLERVTERRSDGGVQSSLDTRLILRAKAHLETLFKLFHGLYHEHAEFDQSWRALFNALCDAAASRPIELQTLDAQRENKPDWFCDHQQFAYCAYVDRFAGSLAGVQQRIPHLRSLGVTYLHLLPFLKMRNGANDGGFAVSDFLAIEPQYGSMDDLRHLTTALREAGISLCSDFVMNHVADDHDWARRALAGDANYLDFFIHFADRGLPDQYEKTLAQIFPQTAPGNFTWNDTLKRWIWTTFYPYQWDLNYRNPQVFEHIAHSLVQLANQGIEIFRLDSAGFLWKSLGTPCMNQPQAHQILQTLRAIVTIFCPAVLLKAEAIVPTYQLPPYFGAQTGQSSPSPLGECHLAYHSSLMAASWLAIAEERADAVHRVLDATPSIPLQTSWLTYIRCHDDIGWNVLRPDLEGGHDNAGVRLQKASRFFAGESGSYAQGRSFQTQSSDGVHGTNGTTAALTGLYSATTPADLNNAIARILLLYGLIMTVGGVPLLYMGDEFGLGNDLDTPIDPSQGVDSRQLQRPKLPPHLLDAQGQRGAIEAQLYSRFQAMIATRRRLSALQMNQPLRRLEALPESIVGFLRSDSFVFLGNFSSHSQTVSLAQLSCNAGMTRALEDVLCERSLSGEHLTLGPWEQAWLSCKSPAPLMT